MKEIYLDNSATTKPSEASLQKMREALCICYGNPGSVHRLGIDAHRLLEEARRYVALSLERFLLRKENILLLKTPL